MKREELIDKGKTQKDNKRDLNNIECKSIWIGRQKHNKMIQHISSWVPVPVKSAALIEYMSPGFDRIVIAWA